MAKGPSEVMTYLDLIVPAVGVAMMLCLLGRKLAKKFNIPKVSIFIFIGIFLGPTGINLFKNEMVYSLDLFTEAALGLILFNIGGAFNKDLLAKIDRRRMLFAFSMITFVFLITFTIFFLFSLFDTSFTLQERLAISLFLGVISIEAAPPTTLLVMREFDAKGVMSQIIMIYLAIGTFMAIIGAKIFTILFEIFGIWASVGADSTTKILMLIWSIVGSLGAGVLLGLGLSWWERKETNFSDIFFVIVTVIVFGQSLAHFLNFDPLLISLTLGFTLVNSSDVGMKIHNSFQSMGLSIYALFFVIAGAHIHLQEQIPTMGIVGMSYILARIASVYFSARLSERLFDRESNIGHGLGQSVLSHAGAALAIVSTISSREEKTAQTVVTIIMTSIFVFEILGPFALKHSLFKAGEVGATGDDAKDKTLKTEKSFKDLTKTLKKNIGISKEKTQHAIINSIADLVVTDIVAIKHNATLKTVKQFLDQHYTFYPIVNEQMEYLGSIDIDVFKKYMAEEDTNFILAENLVGDTTSIPLNTPLNEVLHTFETQGQQALPVVADNTRKFIGVLFYKDVLIHVDEKKNESKFIG